MPDCRYCFTCISKWAQLDSRCPLCIERFRTITHKVLPQGGEDAGGKVLEVLDIPERTQVRPWSFAVGGPHSNKHAALEERCLA